MNFPMDPLYLAFYSSNFYNIFMQQTAVAFDGNCGGIAKRLTVNSATI